MGNINKPSFKDGREITKKAKNINKGLQDCFDLQKDFEKKAINAANKVVRNEAERTLQNLSVDELSKAKLGIRVQALKDAGIYNISQLSRFSEASLERIRGIGPKSAKAIIPTVNKIVRSTYSNQKLKINFNEQTGANDELVRNLYYAQKYAWVSEHAKGIYHGRIYRA